jgi:tripartite-type tricarboxylate transporter receptor subunit TctC
MTKRPGWALAALLVSISCAAPAWAADAWPAKPVRVVAPFAPGGSADTLGRLVSIKLSEVFSQQFVVENKPGAGGAIGSDIVAKSAPDGYTLVVSGIGSHVVAPALNPNLSYDPMKDFTHIALFGGPPTVLIVTKSLAVADLREFLALAKSKPGEISYGTPGIGTHAHLIAELLQYKTGTKLNHVPYRGAGQAIIDIMGGQTMAGSMTLSSAAEQIKAGTVRGIALTSAKRLKEFPDVPTYTEKGYPDLVATTWFSLSGPAGIPADIVKRLNEEVVKALHSPDIRQRLDRDAIDPEPLTAPQFTAFMQAEIDRWTPIVKASGAKPE